MRPAAGALLVVPIVAMLAAPAAAQHRARLAADLAADLAAARSSPDARYAVVVEAPASVVDRLVSQYGLAIVKRLRSGAVLAGPARQIDALASDPQVPSLSLDRAVRATQVMADDAEIVPGGANRPSRAVFDAAGATGAGIGIAVIDSGIAAHPDLDARVFFNVDFVERGGRGDDAYGHGTHIAGVLAGSGAGDARYAGIAPGAHLVNLRVLDEDGGGLTSDVVEAIDWAIAHRREFNIRVINLALGQPAIESPKDDPLVKAVMRAVAEGLVVVTSAGNVGRLDDDTVVVGGIVSPGNAPAAITVGALNTRGTAARGDDLVATWSSRGPVGDPNAPADWRIKPDLVAPGNAVVSTAAASTWLWRALPVERHVLTPGGPYLRLSGTSMAVPMVAATAALMIEANAALSPADVKFALQVTAQLLPGCGLVEQGAGGLNAPLAFLVARDARDMAAAGAFAALVADGARAGGVSFDASEPATWGGRDRVRWNGRDLDGRAMTWGASAVWGHAGVWGVMGASIERVTLTGGESATFGPALVWGTGPMRGPSTVWVTGALWAVAARRGGF